MLQSQQFNCAQAALLDCTDVPAQQFCKELCDQLLCSVETWETAICKLLEVLTHLEEVQVGLQALEASVLEEMGMTRFFKEIIAAIEELWCYGTSGMSDLADRHRQGDLLDCKLTYLPGPYIIENKSTGVAEEEEGKVAAAKAKKQAKVREEVDDDTKIKAIHDLPVVLDRIFQQLSHMTGRWKFSVLMGGCNPEVGGNIRFFDYHLGECAAGGQFADVYVMYSDILKAFASFVDSTIKHEDSLPATNRDHDTEREIDNDLDDEGSDSEADEVRSGESTAAAEVPKGNIGPGSSREWGALYQLTPNKSNASPSQTQFNLLDQLFNYEAAMYSFLETSLGASMDSEGAAIYSFPETFLGASMDLEGSADLPFLPPVGREVLIPPFVWPMPPTPLAFQPNPALHGPQPPVSIEAPGHTLSPAPPPPTFQQASATPRPPTPSTSAPPASQSAPVAESRAPSASESCAPPASAPPVSAPSAPAPPAPAPPASAPPSPEPLPVSASQPIAHHIEEEPPGTRHTGRAHQSVPFNRCELDNVIGDTPRWSGQGSKRGSKHNAENTGNTSNKNLDFDEILDAQEMPPLKFDKVWDTREMPLSNFVAQWLNKVFRSVGKPNASYWHTSLVHADLQLPFHLLRVAGRTGLVPAPEERSSALKALTDGARQAHCVAVLRPTASHYGCNAIPLNFGVCTRGKMV
ncbi:hypothetical protein EDB19DRAFT_1830966 [Suillus lakei]|nr:hypothetical protein EDB19DRAFT_1830966 [Suillus lakei]